MKRYFLLEDAIGYQFWNLETQGEQMTIYYGPVSPVGGTKRGVTTHFDTPETCEAEAEKRIAQKRKQGYFETNEKSEVPPDATSASFGFSWEE